MSLDPCENGWKKIDKNCFLPMYDKMTWYGAFAHCQKLNSSLLKENFPKNVFSNATHKIISSSFWTGKLYETVIDNLHSGWISLNDSVFNEWSRWDIIIHDIGCGGCSFWRNGIIHLTSKCCRNVSYFCGSDCVGKYAILVPVYMLKCQGTRLLIAPL